MLLNLLNGTIKIKNKLAMTEKAFRGIIKNNLAMFKSGRKNIDQVTENIVSCIFEREKIKCVFGSEYCTQHDNGVKPCEKCRVSYEYELTND